jgi:hypothetical protein
MRASCDKPVKRSSRLFPSVILFILCITAGFIAGCITTENPPGPVPEKTTSPIIKVPVSFTGNWTSIDKTGDRLDILSGQKFELRQVSKSTGDESWIRGSWSTDNETVYRLEAFLSSPGGVGLAQYTATCILDPKESTLMICPYLSPEKCHTGLVMIQQKDRE